MLRHYRNALANVKPGKTAIFVAYGATPTDYAAMGVTASLRPCSTTARSCSARSAVTRSRDVRRISRTARQGARPAPPAAASSNGIWLRRYENGFVLVNPQRHARDHRRRQRLQAACRARRTPLSTTARRSSTVTLGARQGLLMLKVPVPCAELTARDHQFAKPKVAALDYSLNTSEARKALLAKFDYVILGLEPEPRPDP